MIKYLLLPVTLLVANISCVQIKTQSVGAYLEELHADNRFNGNVLIVQSDTVVYKNSLGYAQGDKSVQLTEDHLFQVGSIYKEFPAVAIMQLKEKGLLALDDKISDYLKDLPSWQNKITIKHLLQYSSGLPLVDWGAMFQNGQKVSFELALSKLQYVDNLDFAPGEDYLYSNYNPFLLIRIIENISNLAYEEYLEKNILEPFNIDGVVPTSTYPYPSTLNHIFALPFNEEFEEDEMEYELPTICASTDGMYQWFNLIDRFKVVSEESVRTLSEKAIKGDYIQAPLGRGDWKDGELKLHLHHGSTGNYESLVKDYIEEGLMIILLTNQKHRNLHDIADRIHSLLKEEG